MPLFNRRRQLPSDQFIRAEGNAMIPRWTRPPERNTYDWIKMFSKSPRLSVVERIEEKNRLKLETVVTNQKGETVITGMATVMPPKA